MPGNVALDADRRAERSPRGTRRCKRRRASPGLPPDRRFGRAGRRASRSFGSGRDKSRDSTLRSPPRGPTPRGSQGLEGEAMRKQKGDAQALDRDSGGLTILGGATRDETEPWQCGLGRSPGTPPRHRRAAGWRSCLRASRFTPARPERPHPCSPGLSRSPARRGGQAMARRPSPLAPRQNGDQTTRRPGDTRPGPISAHESGNRSAHPGRKKSPRKSLESQACKGTQARVAETVAQLHIDAKTPP